MPLGKFESIYILKHVFEFSIICEKHHEEYFDSCEKGLAVELMG
jgi:hypothetical protein